MRRWIAAAVIVTFASGCLVAPPPPQDAAPPSPGYGGGYANGQDDFARGEEDGRAAARRTPEVGSFCIGVTVGIVLPLAIVAAASGGGGGCGGGSGGSCNGGGEHETLSGGSLPTDASASYSAGYRSGYQQEKDARQGRAALLGFFAGLAIFGVGAAVYLSDPNNRTRTTNAATNPTGAVLLRF